MSSAQLGPEQRRASLDRMAGEVLDIVVVGGGVTGCECALDAATRGLSVALVEQRDYAAGASSRASVTMSRRMSTILPVERHEVPPDKPQHPSLVLLEDRQAWVARGAKRQGSAAVGQRFSCCLV